MYSRVAMRVGVGVGWRRLLRMRAVRLLMGSVMSDFVGS